LSSICTRCTKEVEVVRHQDATGSPLCVTFAEPEPVVQVFVSDSGKGHEDLALKKKRFGEKRPFEEFKSGESIEFRTGVWRKRTQRVGRDNDQYDKMIKDQETGKIIYECHEPLSRHRGHGSDRRKNSETEARGEENGQDLVDGR